MLLIIVVDHMKDRSGFSPLIALPVSEFLHQGDAILLPTLFGQLLEAQCHVVKSDHHHDFALPESLLFRVLILRLLVRLRGLFHALL